MASVKYLRLAVPARWRTTSILVALLSSSCSDDGASVITADADGGSSASLTTENGTRNTGPTSMSDAAMATSDLTSTATTNESSLGVEPSATVDVSTSPPQDNSGNTRADGGSVAPETAADHDGGPITNGATFESEEDPSADASVETRDASANENPWPLDTDSPIETDWPGNTDWPDVSDWPGNTEWPGNPEWPGATDGTGGPGLGAETGGLPHWP